jgi:DNA modification methylase
MNLEMWPTDKLVEYSRNPRKNDTQIDRMVSSFQEFGFRLPILAKSDGLVVDGHLRLKAARKMGIEEVPVVLADDMTDNQIKAFRLLANRSANWAEWDDDLVSLELGDLQDAGFDLLKTGFDEDELDAFLNGVAVDPIEEQDTSDLDTAPAPPRNPVSRPGDIWVMGKLKHRLICGDSTDAATLDKLLGKDTKAAMLVTSPPYWAKQAYDDAPGIQGAADFCAKVSEAWASRIRRRIVINTGTTVETSIDPKGRPGVRILLDAMWTAAMSSAGWDLRNRRVWVKSGPNPNTAPHIDSVDQSWETMLTYWRAGHTEGGQERVSEPWSIAGFFDDIKGVGKDVVGDDHPCPYPVELPRRFILLYSKPGDVVAEPFCGSGTTILAGEVTGRSVHASELSPSYVDVSILRWQEMTGVQAILEATGETFDEVRAYRVVEDEFEELGEPEDEEDAA